MECKHENKEFKRQGFLTTDPNTKQKIKRYHKVLQCNDCGERLKYKGNSLWWPKNSGEDASKLLEADFDLQNKWEAKRQDRLRENRKNDNIIKHQQYEDYIQNQPGWKNRRELVMTRCDGICEGCLLKRATQVHHLNYDTLYNELLWDLKGVCRECHMKAHNLI